MSSAAEDEQTSVLETVESVTLTQDNDGSIILHCPPPGGSTHMYLQSKVHLASSLLLQLQMSRCHFSFLIPLLYSNMCFGRYPVPIWYQCFHKICINGCIVIYIMYSYCFLNTTVDYCPYMNIFKLSL